MYTDQDTMPFGKHKGEKLANVPASYLFWLKDNITPKAPNKRTLTEKYFLKYIEENHDVLIKKLKNK